uniref:Uncharacterized protein n=1 Tax=Rhizophora mucronata TaxID=61149 RepID=A0A2P2NXT2_RHIMU
MEKAMIRTMPPNEGQCITLQRQRRKFA